MKKTRKKMIISIIAVLILISNLPPVGYLFQENYQYQNMDASFIYTEHPGKGLDFEVGEIRFKSFKKENPTNSNVILYRTFSLKIWRFWEWWQMLTHYERFNLPYIDPDS